MLETKYIFTAAFVCFVLFSIHLSAVVLLEERRFTLKKTILLWISAGLIFFLVVFLCYSFLPSTLRLAVSLLVSFLYFWATFIYSSADGMWKKCYLWVTYGTVFCILWPVSVMISMCILPPTMAVARYMLRAVIQLLLCFPLLVVYRKYARPFIRDVSGFYSSSWLSLFIFSIVYFFFSLVLMVLMAGRDWADKTLLLIYLLFIAAYSASSVICFSTIYYIRKEKRDESVRLNVEYMVSYVENAREREEETRRIRHDVRHHNECIAAMARRGDTEGILDYLGQKRDAVKSQKVWCPHIMVNGILSSYASKAEEKDISFSASADIPAFSPIKDSDYVAILANLLENALNAASKIGSGSPVTADITMVGEKTVIVVSNPSEEIRLEDGLPVNRSIGIDSILASSRKYHGEVNYSFSDGICSCCVILSP